MRRKIEQALWFRFRPGGSHLDYLFHQSVVPLRESNFIVSGNDKGFILRLLFVQRSYLEILCLTVAKIQTFEKFHR